MTLNLVSPFALVVIVVVSRLYWSLYCLSVSVDLDFYLVYLLTPLGVLAHILVYGTMQLHSVSVIILLLLLCCYALLC